MPAQLTPETRPRARIRRSGRAGAGLVLSIALAARVPEARAQPVMEGSAATQSAAEALFVEGKRLMAAGAYADACARFAASEQLDPAPGTLLNLGDCYEQNGQLASAWVSFRAATGAAEQIGRRVWAGQASERARLLEPRLTTLTVRVDPDFAPGLEITCNAIPLARPTWGASLPVDASNVRVEAHAPNKKPWAITVDVDAAHPHVVVAVPPLEDVPTAPVGEVARLESGRFRWTTQNTVAVSSAAVGVIAAGVAGGLILAAKAQETRAESESTVPALNDSTAATQEGNVATGLAIGAGVAVLAGVALWVTAPKAQARLSFTGQGLILSGRF